MTKPTKITAWQDSSGALHTCIEGWQQAEMLRLLKETDGSDRISEEVLTEQANDLIKSQSDELLSILTMGPRSKPRARKTPGTTNPKRATKTQARDGFKAMRQAAEGGGVNATRDGDVAAEPSEPVSVN